MIPTINNQTVHNPQMLRKLLEAMAKLINELKTDMSAHVHGGVTAGGANTSAGPTVASETIKYGQ